MPLELVRAQPEHVSELGRIAYEAFKDIADKHHMPLPPTFSARSQRQNLARMIQREDVYGVTALIDDEAVGGAFISVRTEVGAVGPVFVEVPFQGQGVGRAVMENVLSHARRNNVDRVRLMQETYNVASLSLYASLGFDVKDIVVNMEAAAASDEDESIRPIGEDDLPTIEDLCTRIYKVNRRNEVAAFLAAASSPRPTPLAPQLLLRAREGRTTAYLVAIGVGGGHGIAETVGDAIALVCEAARRRAPAPITFNCPMSEGDLYRSALKAGCKALEVMNLMAIGPYEPPNGGVWMPSQFY